jgi:hypothetical protein
MLRYAVSGLTAGAAARVPGAAATATTTTSPSHAAPMSCASSVRRAWATQCCAAAVAAVAAAAAVEAPATAASVERGRRDAVHIAGLLQGLYRAGGSAVAVVDRERSSTRAARAAALTLAALADVALPRTLL